MHEHKTPKCHEIQDAEDIEENILGCVITRPRFMLSCDIYLKISRVLASEAPSPSFFLWSHLPCETKGGETEGGETEGGESIVKTK